MLTDQEEGEGEGVEDLHLADETAGSEANAHHESAVESWGEEIELHNEREGLLDGRVGWRGRVVSG